MPDDLPLCTLHTALASAYFTCSDRASGREGNRHGSDVVNLTLPDGRGIRFDKASRAGIPKAVIEEIR